MPEPEPSSAATMAPWTPSSTASRASSASAGGRPGAGRSGPGPRQPHRRAHRLQRRLRAARRHRPRDAHRVRPDQRRPGAADELGQTGDTIALDCDRPGARRGRLAATTSPAPRGRCTTRACRRTASRGSSTSSVPVGAGLSSSRGARAGERVGAVRRRTPADGPADARAHRPACRERVRRHALRAHGPVRVGVRRRGRAPCCSTAAPSSIGPCRSRRTSCSWSPTPGVPAEPRRGSAYNERRAECEAAVAVLREARSGRRRPARRRRRRCSSGTPTSWIRWSSGVRATSSRRTRACSRRNGRSTAGDLDAVGELFAASATPRCVTCTR